MMKKIVFVSEMKNPNTDASSTQIMTRNLLYGFRRNTDKLFFVAIVENKNDRDDVIVNYKQLCDDIFFIRNLTKRKGSPAGILLSMFAGSFFPMDMRFLSDIVSLCDDETVIISHSPSIDSILVCNYIKRKRKIAKYIQYWSDPIALGLITPEQFSFRRFGHYIVESKMYIHADKIAYGTRSLYNAQISMFPWIKEKAISVDISYSPESEDTEYTNYRIGYFGNYYSRIRNIMPLYEAFCEMPDICLSIYGNSDLKLAATDNIKIYARLPQNEISKKEKEISIEICLLNRIGFQIPGKVFYNTNTSKTLIVILDGPYKNQIKEELMKSRRFVFCNNDTFEIKKTVIGVIDGNLTENTHFDKNYYSPERVCNDIINK